MRHCMDLQCTKEVVCLMTSLLESLVQKKKCAYLLLSQLKMQILNLVFSYFFNGEFKALEQ